MVDHSPGAEVSPPVVVSSRLRELVSGIDALYLSGRVGLSESFLRRLEAAKGRAQVAGESVPFVFGGEEFGLAGHGWGRYPYRLSHEHGLVGLTAEQESAAGSGAASGRVPAWAGAGRDGGRLLGAGTDGGG